MRSFVSMPCPALRVLAAWMLVALAPAAAGLAHAQVPSPAPAPAAPAAVSPPTATGSPAPPKGTRIETPAVIIDGGTIDTLLGKPVRSADGSDMGRIVDVIVDRAGTMRAVIIDFGGFLGVGNRKIAVDWRVLRFPQDGGMDKVVAELSRDQLRVAPVYKAGEPIVVVGRADVGPAPSAPAPASPVAPPAGTPPADKPPTDGDPPIQKP